MRIYLRLFFGIFAIAMLVALGRPEPAVAQECDPDVCANPNQFAKAKRAKKRIAEQKRVVRPKMKQEYLRY